MREPSLYSNKPDMVEHVLGLIDSKIQQIDFKTKQVISSFVDIDSIQVNPPKYGLGEIPNLESSLANNERVLSQIEKYSKTLRLLLLMRAKVDLDNAILVMYLLEENKYFRVKQELLRQILDSPFKYKQEESTLAVKEDK